MRERENKMEIIQVDKCTRCGCNHPVLFYKFENNPIIIDKHVFEYWGICPYNNEPIILEIIDELDQE